MQAIEVAGTKRGDRGTQVEKDEEGATNNKRRGTQGTGRKEVEGAPTWTLG